MSVITQLRRRIGKIDSRAGLVSGLGSPVGDTARQGVLPLGFAPCDAALAGGLWRGALHEITPVQPLGPGAGTGFAAAVAARLLRADSPPLPAIVWIQHRDGMREHGRLYGEGLRQYGLPPQALLAVRAAKPVETLWAMEEALALGLPLVIGELSQPAKATLTATRRLALAAQTGGGIGLLLHHQPVSTPSAALTRWRIAPATSQADRFGGIGLPAFDLTLVKNRHGPCGRWLAHWRCHDHAFLTPEQLAAALLEPALPRGLLPASGNRPGGTGHGAFRRQAPAARRHRLAS